MYRTLLDGYLHFAGRTKWYEPVDAIQKDLKTYLHKFNHEHTHQGCNMNGRTPYKVFIDENLKPKTKKEVVKKAA